MSFGAVFPASGLMDNGVSLRSVQPMQALYISHDNDAKSNPKLILTSPTLYLYTQWMLNTDALLVAPASSFPLAKQLQTRVRDLGSPFFDFWFLGGASIVVWTLMAIGQLLRGHVGVVEQSFAQIVPTFSILALICNHPHFMISYRFGYWRGPKFIAKHWFSLIVVPLALIGLFVVAYVDFRVQVSELPIIETVNQVFENMGFGFRFGRAPDLGTELLSISVWGMFLTVGWHYSKQVFGCLMVYSRFDNYPVSSFQRLVLKSSVFSIAAFNFFMLMSSSIDSTQLSQIYFFNMALAPMQVPHLVLPLTGVWVGLSVLGVLFFVVYKNFKKFGKKPSANFSIAWIAFHIWWIPVIKQPEFYLLAVPFFHSLQYLPFAARMEASKITQDRNYYLRLSSKILLLLVIGFLAFNFVPAILDQVFQTSWNKTASFFTIAAIVFINIHHFFIDSVAWRFGDEEVRAGIFGVT
jgi:hypothetical protein